MKPGVSRAKSFEYVQPSIRAAANTFHLSLIAGPSKFTTTPILSDELYAQGANRAVVCRIQIISFSTSKAGSLLFSLGGRKFEHLFLSLTLIPMKPKLATLYHRATWPTSAPVTSAPTPQSLPSYAPRNCVICDKRSLAPSHSTAA